MNHPLRIIFAGSGEFGLPTLRALQGSNHQIVRVYSQPDRPAGRGRKLTPTPISQYAIDERLPLARTDNLNAESLPDADLLVVIAFGQKIAETIVHQPRLGSVNLHASILPKYRGAAPIHAAILAGEEFAGNSVIRLAQKMDAGAILGQSKLKIADLETAGELHDRLARDGAPLMLEVIESLASGTVQPREQDHSLATVAPKLSRESTRIDWSMSAERIARQIRGLYPWPGCRARVLDHDGSEINRVTLVRARAIDAGSMSAAKPGTISANLAIATGLQALELVELQPEGKRPMPLDAYRNGHRWEAGMTLASLI